jgi:hypothetical protein
MRLPVPTKQRFAVAVLLVTLLGPVGGSLAGAQVGMGMAPGVSHAAMSHSGEMQDPAAMGGSGVQHYPGQSDCAEPGSATPHRCAGLWSTTCCHYFAPGTKIEIDPSLESSARALDDLAVVRTAGHVEPVAVFGPLILPTAGEGRAGPPPLFILHSALLF